MNIPHGYGYAVSTLKDYCKPAKFGEYHTENRPNLSISRMGTDTLSQ